MSMQHWETVAADRWNDAAEFRRLGQTHEANVMERMAKEADERVKELRTQKGTS